MTMHTVVPLCSHIICLYNICMHERPCCSQLVNTVVSVSEMGIMTRNVVILGSVLCTLSVLC